MIAKEITWGGVLDGGRWTPSLPPVVRYTLNPTAT